MVEKFQHRLDTDRATERAVKDFGGGSKQSAADRRRIGVFAAGQSARVDFHNLDSVRHRAGVQIVSLGEIATMFPFRAVGAEATGSSCFNQIIDFRELSRGAQDGLNGRRIRNHRAAPRPTQRCPPVLGKKLPDELGQDLVNSQSPSNWHRWHQAAD